MRLSREWGSDMEWSILTITKYFATIIPFPLLSTSKMKGNNNIWKHMKTTNRGKIHPLIWKEIEPEKITSQKLLLLPGVACNACQVLFWAPRKAGVTCLKKLYYFEKETLNLHRGKEKHGIVYNIFIYLFLYLCLHMYVFIFHVLMTIYVSIYLYLYFLQNFMYVRYMYDLFSIATPRPNVAPRGPSAATGATPTLLLCSWPSGPALLPGREDVRWTLALPSGYD